LEYSCFYLAVKQDSEIPKLFGVPLVREKGADHDLVRLEDQATTEVDPDCAWSALEYGAANWPAAGGPRMALNRDKIDDAALALLYLTLHDDDKAWKGFDWDVLGRLHDQGMIHDPVGKVKSVVFTPEGLGRAKALFEAMFKE
jgi:hypothetical protein